MSSGQFHVVVFFFGPTLVLFYFFFPPHPIGTRDPFGRLSCMEVAGRKGGGVYVVHVREGRVSGSIFGGASQADKKKEREL